MKKISWKKAKGGRSMEHQLEGFVGGELAFIISGRLCVQDFREMKESSEWVPPKAYRLDINGDTTAEAKIIASDLLNGLNVEKHQDNWQKWDDENKKSAILIRDAQKFLDSLKNGMEKI